MSKKTYIALLFPLLMLSPAAAHGQGAQPSEGSGPHIESLMTAAEFRSCGLNKLSNDEIAHLDAWLARTVPKPATQEPLVLKGPDGKMYRFPAGTTEAQAANYFASKGIVASPAAGSPSAIETEIEGDFNGWDGETIFKLANGQIWQQAEYDYEYEYAYRPEVLIYNTAGGYKMKVEGMEDTIFVKRLK
jgi:hypothetical protein